MLTANRFPMIQRIRLVVRTQPLSRLVYGFDPRMRCYDASRLSVFRLFCLQHFSRRLRINGHSRNDGDRVSS